ncbi:hypothetical protein VTL71DRAFT_15269 [Oculimacula yallundae]|uniref:Calcineurin-like phosphoesterase domain-containing protein n=1 Tax=Oculimacula yallundae TaxID=86028 RepID=A0ABR4CHD8_9HELO
MPDVSSLFTIIITYLSILVHNLLDMITRSQTRALALLNQTPSPSPSQTSSSSSSSKSTASPSSKLKIKVQIYADLHLEVSMRYASKSKSDIPALSPYLFLAGDIGSLILASHRTPFQTWLEKQCKKFKYVVYVAGNHEFHGTVKAGETGVETGIREMRRLASLKSMGGRLVCLENERWDVPGRNVSILGCVLWSRLIPKQIAVGRLGDLGSIAGTSIVKHNARFEISLKFIKEQVRVIREEESNGGEERRIVVMTHYCPMSLAGTRPGNVLRGSWSNWQTDILDGEGVEGLRDGDAWVHGHTHFSHDSVHDGIRVIANSRGYDAEGEQRTRFEWEKVFEI